MLPIFIFYYILYYTYILYYIYGYQIGEAPTLGAEVSADSSEPPLAGPGASDPGGCQVGGNPGRAVRAGTSGLTTTSWPA